MTWRQTLWRFTGWPRVSARFRGKTTFTGCDVTSVSSLFFLMVNLGLLALKLRQC